MLSIFSGLIMAFIRTFTSYSNSLKSICILIFSRNKKEEISIDNRGLIDDNNNNNKDELTISKNNTYNNNNDQIISKAFIDIERKILENVIK
jgi:hypothetical protein